jgi:hypothetical protein
VESYSHKVLKLRAKEWLRSRGCKDIREEVSFSVDAQHKVVIDIVGYKDDKPVMGIECGMANNDSTKYRKLKFHIYSLPYGLGYEYYDADDIEAKNGRPWVLLNGPENHSAREKPLEPMDIWRERFEREREARRKPLEPMDIWRERFEREREARRKERLGMG